MSDMNLEEGEYEGRLVRVADLGWHQDEYQGQKKKPAKKAALGIEIVGYDVEINEEKQPRMLWTRPFNIFPSLTEKGKEMEFYSVFDTSAEAGQESDWENQLGKPCNVVVKHGWSKDGQKKFDNIERLTPIPAKYRDKVEENRLEPHAWDEQSRSNLFGLARWMYEQRMEEQSKKESGGLRDDFDDDSSIPF